MVFDRFTIFACALALCIFSLDLFIPLGVAFGVPYIIVIMLGLRSNSTKNIVFLGFFCTFLVILGLDLSPEASEMWKVYMNRVIALMAIWSVAGLGLVIKRDEKKLQNRNKSIALMQNIASAANVAGDIDEAVQSQLDLICGYTGWPIGHYYKLPERGEGELVSSGIWHLENPDKFSSFRKITANTRFRAGVGLPGRVLSSGEPVWIRDVTEDDNFPRANIATDIGVRGAIGFPVKIGEEVKGVLEFYSDEIAGPRQDDLEIMSQVGTQLGRVIERYQTQQRIKRFSGIFENSLNEIYIIDPQTTKFIQANQAAVKNLGYHMEELLMMSPLDILPDFDQASMGKMSKGLLSGAEDIVVYETRHRR